MDGDFELGPLVAGEYRLAIVVAGVLRTQEAHAQGGDDGVVLRLDWARALHGHISSPTMAPIEIGRAVISRPGIPEYPYVDPAIFELGFRAPPLSRGTYDVAVTTADGLAGFSRGVEVTADPLQQQPDDDVWRDPTALAPSLSCQVEVAPAARLAVELRGSGADHFTVHLDGVLVGFGRRNSDEIDAVPPGRLLVRTWTWRHELVDTREVFLGAGHEAALDFGQE